MDIFDIGMWAGTEATLETYTAALERVASDGTLSKTRAEVYGAQEESRPPRLFSKQGEIGVITIAGSLNNSDSWINEYLGATGYPEIREALIYAAGQADVKAIALDVQSGGGSVSGVSDTADLIKAIDSSVKPVHTYSDGIIASAAYWLGASARSVSIGNVAEAGSIGVLIVHREASKMMQASGITTNVIRSGKYKALGNSAEPLSDLAKETLQAQVDQLNGLFVAHVADVRGTTAASVEERMGQGRVFIGQSAVDVGLVDAVTNFDKFMAEIQGGIDSAKQQPKYGANLPKGSNVMPKTALTAEAIAALALGAVALTPEQITSADAARALETAAVVQAEAAAAVVVESELVAAGPAAAPAPAPVSEVVTMLQGQLATAQDKVLALSVELQGSKAAADAAKASAESMLPIVRAAVGNLRIALGGTSAGVEALTNENLIAEHANLAAQFDKKFKAGGVAAVTLPAAAETEDASTDPVRRARLDATRNSKQK